MAEMRRNESGQVLLDCIIQIAKLLTEKGVESESAIRTGTVVAEFLAKHWNGSTIYFSSKLLACRVVEAELEQNFDGSRDYILALVRKHNVSERFCYSVLQRLREKRKKNEPKGE